MIPPDAPPPSEAPLPFVTVTLQPDGNLGVASNITLPLLKVGLLTAASHLLLQPAASPLLKPNGSLQGLLRKMGQAHRT